MRITAKLTPTAASQALVISADQRPLNVLKGDVDKPFLSCAFSDLADIRTHYELASRKFSNILIFITGPLNPTTISSLVLVCKNAASLSLEIPADSLIRDYRELFAMLISEEDLRFLCLKGKKVGEWEWAIA